MTLLDNPSRNSPEARSASVLHAPRAKVGVVINVCYGGFGLSEAAIRRYAEIKGLTLYPEESRVSGWLTTWWIVPTSERIGIIPTDDWYSASLADRQASNRAYDKFVLTPSDIDREDPALVQVVEELGAAASGPHAKLVIQDLDRGTAYAIDEYDGLESLRLRDQDGWRTAGLSAASVHPSPLSREGREGE